MNPLRALHAGTLAGLLALLAVAPARAQIQDIAEAYDSFGRAVATGDFDGDGFDDLAVGVPYEDIRTIVDAGAVSVIYGASGVGLDTTGDQFWRQNSAGINDVSEEYDWFGYSLASGDFDGDGFLDLAVGVQYEDIGTITAAGAVNVIYGGSGVGLTEVGDQFWNQDTAPEPRAEGDDEADAEGEAAAAPEATVSTGVPLAFALEPAAPNPVAAATRLAFTLPAPGPVRLAVYDVLGREVALLVDGEVAAGRHEVRFEAASLPSGTYLVRLASGGRVQTRPLTLAR